MLLAGFLSRVVMQDCQLSPALEVVERIHTNHFLSFPDHQLNETQREREREREGERGREREGERGREREICDLTPQRLKNTILDGVPYAKHDLLAASHSTHSRRASSTSVSRRHKIAYTTRQNQSGNIKQGPVSVWVSLLQKMISQRQSIQATPEEPQAPPLAEAQILPKQLDKPTVARPSKAHPLSGTSGKLQLMEAGPLDLYGCQSHQVPCRTKHKYNPMADRRPLSSPISCKT